MALHVAVQLQRGSYFPGESLSAVVRVSVRTRMSGHLPSAVICRVASRLATSHPELLPAGHNIQRCEADTCGRTCRGVLRH
jgi:hypothetical protein